jgi:hypothetical protein
MRFILTTLIILLSAVCFAQNQFWKNNVSIRRAFESKDDQSKPASFLINWPKDNKNYYLINGGVSISFDKIVHNDDNNSLRLATSLFYVHNRNNQIDKVQNSHKAGITFDFKRGWFKIDSSNGTLVTTRSYWKIVPSFQYLNTRIPKDTSNSFVSTLYLTWLRKWKGFVLNDYNDLGSSGLQLYIGPAVGFEYQQKFNSKKDSINGGIYRLYFSGAVRFGYKQRSAPDRPRKLGYRVAELSLKYTGRNELSNSSLTEEGYISLFTAEFNIFPFAKSVQDNISIGLSFNKGEDPIAGLQKQQYWQLAFKFKK